MKILVQSKIWLVFYKRNELGSCSSLFFFSFPSLVHPLLSLHMEKTVEEMSEVNASSFLLFESSGDSESVSDTLLPEIEEDDDDAHSFCDDLSGLQSCGDDVNGSDVKSCAEDEEWSGDDTGTSTSSHKSRASLDSTHEFESLNETEKSKLFWETCLAS